MTKFIPPVIVNVAKREFHKETHINRALQAVNGRTYVEIGVRSGTCFGHITAGNKIGIDPAPMNPAHKLAKNEQFFQMTSDDFFATEADKLFSHFPIDVALVDGLHEFCQALRDVLNLERFMSKNGIIFMHDCNPRFKEHAELRDGIWNGDVWKVPYYLKTYRTDLCVYTLDCDFGLGIISGFGRLSRIPTPDSEMIRACKSLGYQILDKQRRKVLGLRPFWFSRILLRRQTKALHKSQSSS